MSDAEPIAIVGAGCVLPGAFDVASFWRRVMGGETAIAPLAMDEPWDWSAFYDPAGGPDRSHSLLAAKVRGYSFDWRRFKMPPADVSSINPMQLMILDAGRQALDEVKRIPTETTGLFLGATGLGWQRDTGLRVRLPQLMEALEPALAKAPLTAARRTRVLDALKKQLDAALKPVSEDNVVGASASVALGRISMHYDLKGLHYSIDAGFASSLAALDVGVRALRDGTLDLAVVGGASELLTPLELVAFTHLGGLAKTGVFPFDARAEGTLLGEGAALFALKRLDDAIADGDTIRAVVRGVAGSSDGRGKALVAPQRDGQVRGLLRAYDDAGVDPRTVGFVECHATGTPVGDATEVGALKEVYAGISEHEVLLGSAKPFVGHLRGGAGAVGLLRAMLAVEHGEVPAQLGFERPAAELELERSPFVVPRARTSLSPVGGAAVRRAGVSAIGFGGANYHAVLEAFSPTPRRQRGQRVQRDIPIAIVGMGGRFPGADDVPSFWRSLLDEHDATREVPQERWDISRHFDVDPTRPDTSYTKLGCFLDELPGPAPEWRIPPSALANLDPSQLLVLHAAEEAVKDAALEEGAWNKERTAVMLAFLPYQGKKFLADLRVNFSAYRGALLRALGDEGVDAATRDALLVEVEGRFKAGLPPITEDTLPGYLGNVCAARIAQRFDLHGAAFVVDSACASTHAAVHAAATALRHGLCDTALSGGVWCDMMPEFFIAACRFNALSATGSTPFDAAADGFIPGEGAGIFVLRRLEDAERDGQRVHAVIRSVAGSSDGKGRSVLAPTREGESLAMTRALLEAKLVGGDVGYVECHGTGTALGDVVEVEATRAAYTGARERPLLIGSVKSNIGHLNAAAGVPAMIKAAMALREGVLPASLKVTKPNPNIDFGDGGDERPVTRVVTARRTFEPARDGVRRAGVSGFGVGGSNMHLILEEHRPPAKVTTVARASGEPVAKGAASDAPLPILAVSGADLEACLQRLREFSRDLAAADEARFARELRASQEMEHGPFRVAIVATHSDRFLRRALVLDGAVARQRPLSLLAAQGVLVTDVEVQGKLAVTFPGQGPQYANMMREAAARFAPLAEVLDTVDEAYRRIAGRPLRQAFFTDAVEGWTQRDEDIHCAVFAVNCALFAFLARYGLRPDAFIGQSAGELSALVAAGALSLEDGLTAVRERTLSVLSLDVADPGRMLALGCSAEDARALLHDLPGYAAVAADNCPSACIVSAEGPAALEIEARAVARSIDVSVLPVSHGYHSQIIAGARERYAAILARMQVRPLRAGIVSTITGTWLRHDPASLPAHLASQFVEPVRLQAAVKAAYDDGVRLFVECGPKWPVSTFVGEILAGRPHLAQATLHPKTGEVEQLARALSFAFVNGRAQLVPASTGAPFAEPALTRDAAGALDQLEAVLAPLPEGPSRRAALMALRDKIDSLLSQGDPAPPAAAPTPAPPSPPASPAPSRTQAAPAPSARGSSAAAAAAGVREIQAQLTERLAHRTGYPADMLEPQLDLEGDLGIDTVKQVAVLAEVRSSLGLPVDPAFRLREVNTIEKASRYLASRVELLASGAAPELGAPAQAPAPTPAPAPSAEEPSAPRGGAAASDGDRSIALKASSDASVAGAAAPAAASQSHRSDEVRALLIQQLSERTGYPADMLDLDLDLEGDLGIDTVKQVAVLAAVRTRLGLAQDPGFRLREVNTIRKAAAYLAQRLKPEDVAPAVASAPAGPAEAKAEAAKVPRAPSVAARPALSREAEAAAQRLLLERLLQVDGAAARVEELTFSEVSNHYVDGAPLDVTREASEEDGVRRVRARVLQQEHALARGTLVIAAPATDLGEDRATAALIEDALGSLAGGDAGDAAEPGGAGGTDGPMALRSLGGHALCGALTLSRDEEKDRLAVLDAALRSVAIAWDQLVGHRPRLRGFAEASFALADEEELLVHVALASPQPAGWIADVRLLSRAGAIRARVDGVIADPATPAADAAAPPGRRASARVEREREDTSS